MMVWQSLVGKLLGPNAAGQIPPGPSNDHQRRIDQAKRQLDDLERDIFTRRMQDTWRGGSRDEDLQ